MATLILLKSVYPIANQASHHTALNIPVVEPRRRLLRSHNHDERNYSH